MTYNEDLIRLLKSEVDILRNKVEELEAKLQANKNIEHEIL